MKNYIGWSHRFQSNELDLPTDFLRNLTRRMARVEQKLLPPWSTRVHPGFCGILVAQSLVFCSYFLWIIVCPFWVGHCFVCPSVIYWLLLYFGINKLLHWYCAWHCIEVYWGQFIYFNGSSLKTKWDNEWKVKKTAFSNNIHISTK